MMEVRTVTVVEVMVREAKEVTEREAVPDHSGAVLTEGGGRRVLPRHSRSRAKVMPFKIP